MPKRKLPPEVAAQIDATVADFADKLKDCLTSALRFYRMEIIDACLEVLDEHEAGIPIAELAGILQRGGIIMPETGSFGGPEGNLKRSLGFYTGRMLKIKEVNGIIGRVEWPDEKFSTDASKEKPNGQ